MSKLTSALTHKQQVLRLYKAAVKECRNFTPEFTDIRYKATIVRSRFEENRHIQDLRLARVKLLEGQREFEETRHPLPFQYSYSPGGISYGREPASPDYVLDQWHPLEKAQFPDYFKKRVELKKEYITWYVKRFGLTTFNPETDEYIDDHAHDHDHSDDHISSEAKTKQTPNKAQTESH